MNKIIYIAVLSLFTIIANTTAQKQINPDELEAFQNHKSALKAQEERRMEEAGEYYLKVLDYDAKTFGKSSPQYANTLFNLYVCCKEIIHPEINIFLIHNALEIFTDHFISCSEYMSNFPAIKNTLTEKDIDYVEFKTKEMIEAHSRFLSSMVEMAEAICLIPEGKYATPEEKKENKESVISTINKADEMITTLYYILEENKEYAYKYTHALLKVGNLYYKTEKYSKALETYQKALKEHTKWNTLHANEIYMLQRKTASCYLKLNKIRQAESIFKELSQAQSIANLTNSHQHTLVLNNLANIYFLKNDLKKGEIQLQNVIQAYSKNNPAPTEFVYTYEIPEFIETLCATARICKQKGLIENTIYIYKQIDDHLATMMAKGNIDENNVDAFWNIIKKYIDEINLFAYENRNKSEVMELLCENNLLAKSILTYSNINIIKPLNLNKEPHIRSLFEQTDSIGRNMETFNLYHKDRIPQIRNYLKLSQLAKDTKEYLFSNRIVKKTSLYEWREVAKKLEDEEMVIEFISINKNNHKTYCAITYHNKSNTPTLTALCTEDRLKNLLERQKNNQSSTSKELYELIWQPLESLLQGHPYLYISTTDFLNYVSFSGMKGPKGFLCDTYFIRNFSYSNDILALKQTSDNFNKIKDIYLFGGAAFNLPVDTENPTRGQGFTYLPASKNEIKEICKYFPPEWNTHFFMGEEATEKQFRLLSYKQETPNIIHISTHGFVIPYTRADENAEELFIGYNNVYGSSFRCGIAFTGANQIWNKNKSIHTLNDGILTALEISFLNLTNTELAVLSACNTGITEISDRRMEIGIQQAFRAAGAHSILVSLWDVPDKETAELMKEFYANWSSDVSKADAFTKAQKMMRNKYPDKPEKWAGFVLME